LFVVLIPVDSEGKLMQELVVRSILQELDGAKQKKDWKDPRETQHWKIAKDLGKKIDAEVGDWYQ
jgi:hypothetical protein